MSLGDALVVYAGSAGHPASTAFVTWDARHFRGRVSPPALTPSEYLADV